MKTIEMAGHFSQARNHFELDTKFRGEMAEILLKAYEDASKSAARHAKWAVSSGDLPSIRKAQWYEAVVQTLEMVLGCVEHMGDSCEFEKDHDIELPEPPEFSR